MVGGEETLCDDGLVRGATVAEGMHLILTCMDQRELWVFPSLLLEYSQDGPLGLAIPSLLIYASGHSGHPGRSYHPIRGARISLLRLQDPSSPFAALLGCSELRIFGAPSGYAFVDHGEWFMDDRHVFTLENMKPMMSKRIWVRRMASTQ